MRWGKAISMCNITNYYYSSNFQKLPPPFFFCEIRALSKERVLSPHQQVAKALQFIL